MLAARLDGQLGPRVGVQLHVTSGRVEGIRDGDLLADDGLLAHVLVEEFWADLMLRAIAGSEDQLPLEQPPGRVLRLGPDCARV